MKYQKFKEKVLHKEDDLFAILFVNFLTLRIAYWIKEYKIKITPNQVTYSRMFVLAPLIILFLLIAPFYGNPLFYLIALILSYFFIASDWLDGQIARGTNQTSSSGAFLDSVADRCSTILFTVLLFSVGLWYQNIFIFNAAVILFVLKSFHLMVITKLFYYGLEKGKNNQKIFDGSDAGLSIIDKILAKISKVVKIKRWKGTLGGAERLFLTLMLPLILILLNLNLIVIIMLYIFIVLFALFFMIRIKNIFKGLK